MTSDTLFTQICTWENIWLAYRNAARGKRGRPATAGFEYQLADQLLALQNELRTQTYCPGKYHNFYIHEPKRRLISAAPFRDRVVHHAICNLTVPWFERRFIFDSYANRPGKGTHRALDRCQGFARRFRYTLQCDIVQFFPAIDHAILRKIITTMLPDESAFWVIDSILASGRGVLAEAFDMVYFPGDDLFANTRPRGLPIGNLTSQWWANCYLSPLDHFVKRELRCSAYLRYVDDFLLFSNSKAQLWEWREAIIKRLAQFRLVIHEKQAHPRPVTEGIPFLGFEVYPAYRRLKKRKGIHFRRKLQYLLKIGDREKMEASLRGWVNHARFGNTYGLRRAVFADCGILFEEGSDG
jgi:RNA-directed DNA polymerase